MEIKSTLLNDKDFDKVRENIIAISQIDNEQDFRVKLIEYINDSSESDDDKFFYDMLVYTRFLEPSNESIAFTDPYHRIFLNAPGTHIGKNYKQWDFTYDHECLHQLWDTFGVADKIKESGIEYNHYVLNVASDCVINDYLYYYRKKDMPDGLITPEYIREHYGVTYDRKVDTQYSLYCKLIEKKDIIEKDDIVKGMYGKIKPKSVSKQQGPTPPPPPPGGKHSKDYVRGWTDAIADVVKKKVNPTDKNYKPKSTGNDEYDKGYNDCMKDIKQGLEDGIQLSDSQQQGGGGGDLPQIPWDTPQQQDDSQSGGSGDSDSTPSAEDSAADAQNSANAAKDAADAAQDAADKAKENGDSNAGEIQKNADDAKKAADEAQNAADKARAAADKADDARAAEAAKEAADAARRAADAAAKTGDKEAQDAAKKAEEAAKQSNNNGQKQKPKGQQHIAGIESETDLEKLKKEAEETIKDYANKLAGDLGTFVAKGKSSARLEDGGLGANVIRGAKGWNQELDFRINKYVKQKVFQKKRQYQSTYSRIKRGVGYVKMGEPLQPGRRIKDETMMLNVAFYIDRSGSMGGSIDNVFDACYTICEALKKKYGKEKVIEDIAFKILAFDEEITELEYGKRLSSGGTTMNMTKLLKSIEKYSNNFLANVVITDGYFDINDNEVKNFINNVNGIVVYIINREMPEMEKLAKDLDTKLFYIEADGDFKLK